jgi:hypothetical protein
MLNGYGRGADVDAGQGDILVIEEEPSHAWVLSDGCNKTCPAGMPRTPSISA